MDVEKEERVEDSLEQEEGEIVEDSFDQIQEQDDKKVEEVASRVVLDFDLNEETDYEFDLNKFSEKEGEKKKIIFPPCRVSTCDKKDDKKTSSKILLKNLGGINMEYLILDLA